MSVRFVRSEIAYRQERIAAEVEARTVRAELRRARARKRDAARHLAHAAGTGRPAGDGRWRGSPTPTP